MTRSSIAAALAAATLAAAPAVADTVIVYDDSDQAMRFATKRAVVDAVQEQFGDAAVYGDAAELPASVRSDLVPGDMLPAGAPHSAPPAELGELPRLAEDSAWLQVGDHLAEVRESGEIVMVVYDALP